MHYFVRTLRGHKLADRQVIFLLPYSINYKEKVPQTVFDWPKQCVLVLVLVGEEESKSSGAVWNVRVQGTLR